MKPTNKQLLIALGTTLVIIIGIISLSFWKDIRKSQTSPKTSQKQQNDSSEGTSTAQPSQNKDNYAKSQSITQSPAGKPQAKTSDCFTVNFQYKNPGNNTDCTLNRNLLNLGNLQAIPQSVCVRVNGTPVPHKISSKKPFAVVIAPVGSPKVSVTVTYCTAKSKCAGKCIVPKDEFMDAIGGIVDDLSDENSIARWDSDSAPKDAGKVEKELKKELGELKGLMTDENNKNAFFAGWEKAKEEPFCNGNDAITAQNNDKGKF